ncbi:alpha/beta hydrolase [Membranihabitans maritimus]|uniref:alpha/beta hydrolase n=1 Tax=Membranihabitans maritimus TaxID=2904244 RepID=UPI001F28FF1D|nr:alpha/beta hydrolase [Membranihabitans maritimus]
MLSIIALRIVGFTLNSGSKIFPKYTRKKGLDLFSKPARLKLKKEQLDFFNTAENLIIPFNKEKIRIYKWGGGSQSVLFCHGWQSHSYRWFPYVEKLDKQRFTLYAMDGPTSGQTTGKYLNLPIYAAYVQQIIQEIGEFDFYVGHSLGAFTLLYTLSRKNSLSPKAAVTLASPGNALDFTKGYVRRMRLADSTFDMIKNEFGEVYGHHPSVYHTKEFVNSLSIPGLIVHDKEDKRESYQHALEIHNTWEKAKLITTNGLGHRLRSEEVVNKVVDFIEGHY